MVVGGIALSEPSGADDSIKFKVRIQPRSDFGDFAASDGTDYRSQLDLYLRRSRLEVSGRPTDGVSYILAVSSDRWGQRGSAVGGEVTYAFVNYRLSVATNVQAGLAKLPFVRSATVSSSRLLLIERTKTASAASSALGPYITPNLALSGRFRDGAVGYNLAVTDGFQQGDSDSFTRAAVAESDNPGFVGRIEISPGGWVEGRPSASHLGVGRHLTVGVNGAFQRGIDFGTVAEDRTVIGGDLSFHQGGLSFQSEYLRVDRDGSVDSAPEGWYVQLGYYLGSRQLEPAVRFERYDADLPGGKATTTTYTGGLNWYRHGHDLKHMANVVHSSFDRGVREVGGPVPARCCSCRAKMYF
jgi:hypothetical protein